MARISCSCLFGSAFTVLLWLIVSALFIGPLTIVWREVYSAFYGPGAGVYRPTGVEHMSNELLCTPMWQKPFDYGVKVYASLEHDAFSNPQEFFDSAQLLWHSEPASLDNQYPKLATTAAVDIPSALYSADSINATLYAHIFIQAAGNLVPHPDVHDTSLVYSTAHLARWRPISKFCNRTDNNSKLFELVAATKLPWAIILENHTYKLKELPSYISKVSGTFGVDGSVRSVYKPPVFENTFTESRGNVESLAQQNDDGSMTYDSNKTHSVQLTLQGIKSGWIQLLKFQTAFAIITNTTVEILQSNFSEPSLVPNPGFQIPANLGDVFSLAYISLKSMVIACILIIFMVPVAFLQIQTSLAFWLGPRSKWAGLSRTYTFVGVLGLFLENAIKWYSEGGVMILVWMGYYLSVMLKLMDLPANPRKWPSYISEKLALYRQASAASVSSDSQDQELVTMRRSVDYAAFKWICKLGLPALVAVTAHTLAYSKESMFSAAFIVELVRSAIYYSKYVDFVPQVALNHGVRSGSLIPPVINIGNLCLTLINGGIYYNTMLTQYAMTSDDWSETITSIIFVVQWLVYR